MEKKQSIKIKLYLVLKATSLSMAPQPLPQLNKDVYKRNNHEVLYIARAATYLGMLSEIERKTTKALERFIFKYLKTT